MCVVLWFWTNENIINGIRIDKIDNKTNDNEKVKKIINI